MREGRTDSAGHGERWYSPQRSGKSVEFPNVAGGKGWFWGLYFAKRWHPGELEISGGRVVSQFKGPGIVFL